MNKKNLLCIISCISLVSGCGITKPDVKMCAVAGVLSAGADCVHTLSTETNSMTLDETIQFLEAQPDRADPKDPNRIIKGHAAALMIASEDWTKIKNTIEAACLKVGCTKEIASTVASIDGQISSLRGTSTDKKVLSITVKAKD